jgi:selenocysteine lyase/cysteine desulfurase
MTITRRQFLGTVVSTPAIGALLAQAQTNSSDDPLSVRKDFPIVNEKIYLNSSYIAPCPMSVTQAGCAFLEAKMRRPIALEQMLEKTDEVRRQFAGLVGVSPGEVGFLSSTSEGENIVVNSLELRPGDNVVVDDLHYSTSYAIYKHLESAKGVQLRIAKNRDGRLSVEDFAALVDKRTRLISVAWVSHQNGFRHDMKALADLAHSQGAFLYTDAIQATGMFPINLRETGVDFLASGTYKWLLAGFGVAPFYVRGDLLDRIRPDREGHMNIEKALPGYQYQLFKTAKKFEYATLSFISIYQLGASLAYLSRLGLERIESHTVALARELRKGLGERGFRLFTPEGNGSSIVTFFNPKPQDVVSKILEEARIEISFRENGTQIRIGIALFNNSSEIRRLLETAEKFGSAQKIN